MSCNADFRKMTSIMHGGNVLSSNSQISNADILLLYKSKTIEECLADKMNSE